jgi:heterodisulfide reductase subunit A-like polyferredoxin
MNTRNAVIYCTCCDTLSPVLPADALERKLGARAPLFITARRLCAPEDARACVKLARDAGAAACVAAGCSYLARGVEAVGHMDLPVEWVDIREACAWIHAGEQALEKAADYIRMGLAALEHRPAEASTEVSVNVAPLGPADPVLIVGAGPAGLAAAAVLAEAGVPAVLAERRPAPGGMLQQLGLLFPDLGPAADIIAGL